MKNVIFTLMMVVAVFASCTKLETPDDLMLNQMKSESTVQKKQPEQPKQDTLTFNRDIKVNGNEAIATLTALVNGEAKATATTRIREYRQKNRYAITAEQRSITPAYANAKVSFSEENGVKANFPQEDGNIIYVEVSYTDTKVELNGEEKDILADRLDVVKVFNLDEIEAAAATKAVVTDTVYNKTVVEFRLENYQDESYLEDETLVRYYSYNVEDPIVPTTDKWELVANRIENSERYSSVDHIQYYSDGHSELIKNYSARIPVSAKVLSDWERTCKDFSQSTSSLSAISTDKVAANNGEVYWNNYTVVYGNDVTLNEASASNSWEIKEARELVVKENGEVVYTFPELNSEVKADNGNVKNNGTYADYTCTLTYTYDGTPMTLVAPGKINKEEEKPADPVITEDWDKESAKDELTDTERIISIDWVKYSDGKEVDRKPFKKSFPRSFEVLTNWSSTQESYSQSTNAAEYTTTSDKVNNGEWTYSDVKVVIKNVATLADGAKMNNEWQAKEVNDVVVTYNGKSYTFSNKSISVSDKASVDNNGKYGDELTYNFGGNKKSLVAPGQINKPAAPTIIREYWDSNRAKDELTDNQRVTSIYWMTEWSDGKKEEQFFELTSSRSLEVLTNWTSTQKNYNENTSSASYTTSSNAESKGEWSYNKVTVSIKNVATLADGAQMNNGWEAREINDIVVTYKGKSYNFSNKSISLSDYSSVSSNGKYSDVLSYTFGENTKQATAPGTINKKATEISGVAQSVCPTSDKKGYIYTMIVRYDDGKSLPVIINNGSVSTLNKVENLDSRVNGASLNSNGEWVLTIAEDSAENMTYVTPDGKLNCQMSYTKAKQMNWDEGRTVNGHSSVHTSRYSVNSNGQITDSYTNSVIGTL